MHAGVGQLREVERRPCEAIAACRADVYRLERLGRICSREGPHRVVAHNGKGGVGCRGAWGMHVDPQRLASSSDSRLPRVVVDGSSAVGAGTMQLRTSHEAGEMREGIAARERHVFGVRLRRRREDWARSRCRNIELGGDVAAQSTWGSVSDGRGRGGGRTERVVAKVQEGRGCLARLGGRPGRGAVKVARATFFPVSLQGGQIPVCGYSARHYAGRKKTDESGQGVSPRHTLYPHLLSV